MPLERILAPLALLVIPSWDLGSQEPSPVINLRLTAAGVWDEGVSPDLLVVWDTEMSLGKDLNGDGSESICGGLADAISVFNWLYLAASEPPCLAACDANGDGGTPDVSDGIYILQFCALGGSPPPAPFPDCGRTLRDEDFPLRCAAPACP